MYLMYFSTLFHSYLSGYLSCPQLFYPNLSCPIQSYLILSFPIFLFCPVLFQPILSHPVLPYPFLSYFSILYCPIPTFYILNCILSYPVLSSPILSYPYLFCPNHILSYSCSIAKHFLSCPFLSFLTNSYIFSAFLPCTI